MHFSIRSFALVATSWCACALGGAPVASPQGCGTVVPPGNVAQTWTAAGSPYCVTGDINVTLFVQPGVEVVVEGPFQITVIAMAALGTPAQPIVFRQGSGGPWKGLKFTNSLPGTRLEHCRIEGADDSGLTILTSRPTFTDCVIENNTSATDGGGIRAALSGGDLLLTRCRVVDNSAEGHGGGISAIMTGTARLVLEGCTVSGNLSNPNDLPSDRDGGGLRIEGPLQARNCVFAGNTVQSRCDVPGCSTQARGGGLFVAGDAVLENCIVEENHVQASESVPAAGEMVASRGAGIHFASGTSVLRNCIVTCGLTTASTDADTPLLEGGGIYVDTGTVDVVNCTIVRNDREGVFAASGTVSTTNSILYFNNSGADQMSGAVSAAFCNVENGALGTGNLAMPPFLSGPGCGYAHMGLLLASPCRDTGDADPAFDDAACYPTSFGTPRNDMGVYGGPLACAWDATILGHGFAASPGTVSVSAGGTQTMDLLAGSDFSNGLYFIVGSTLGSLPGFFLGDDCLPLIPFGAYWKATLLSIPVGLTSYIGFLDADGETQRSFVVPPGSPASLVGRVFRHVFVVFEPTPPLALAFTSNAVELLLAP